MHTEVLEKLAEGVSRGEYSLLLGAGASIGARGGNDVPLPSGPQLRDKLVQEFSIPTEGEIITLSRAYSAAQRGNRQKLDQFMSAWFTNCKPSWQHQLIGLPWHRVWTLNVDDVIESACGPTKTPFQRFNWTSKYRDKSYSGLQIVHLHGFMGNGSSSDDSDLVFSTSEYAGKLQDPRAWHMVFNDEFAELPFIVLGASLTEEFDLQAALSSSASEATRGFPSAIVLKTVSALEREELTDLGLVVIESDAETFIRELRAQIETYHSSIGAMYGRTITPEITRFLQQFVDLRRFEPQQNDSSHNFYAGYEPHWKNILDEDDAEMQTTEAAWSMIRAINETAPFMNQSVHVLTGRAGTGKSTGLLRIARHVVAQGIPTFQFRGDEDLDVDATSFWLIREPKTVLIFNDCADFADSIGELAERCSAENIDLTVIGADRSTRRHILEREIPSQFLHMNPDYEYKLLSDLDIRCLLDKLRTKRRLGHITGYTRARQHGYFAMTASRRLFEGMADLEGGPGFRRRIREAYRLIDRDSLRELYAAASISFELGYPLPLRVATQVAGLTAKQLVPLLTSDEQEMFVLDRSGVRPTHRITASLVVESALSIEDKAESMRKLMLALAPHIDVQAIQRSTRLYRLVRRLMDQETVMRLLGEANGRHLYELIHGAYDWNGRYWEQRALFESELGNHTQARSYAEHSLQIHRHPFAFNTLGTVLGRIALQYGNTDALRDAVKNLELARNERRWDASEHPYITFFNSMIRFGEKWGIASIAGPLRNEFDQWQKHAVASKVFTGADGRERLQGFQREWLSLAVGSAERE